MADAGSPKARAAPVAGMTDEQIVARALGYPFERPPTSVALVGERVLELIALDDDNLGASKLRDEGESLTLAEAAARAGIRAPQADEPRTPVLAYGSNASPGSVRWKFPDDRQSLMPLLRGSIRDLDVVYSAHIAVYGSVPATLQRSPGTEVQTFVALLTDAQLEQVTAWEINATYETLGGVELSLDHGSPPSEVGAFVSRHGCLTIDGSEVALAAVPARGRRLAELPEPEVLRRVCERVAPGKPLDAFVLESVRDYDKARRHNAVLRADARPFARSPR